MQRTRRILIAMVGASLAAAPSAFAQTPGEDAYRTQAENVQGALQAPGANLQQNRVVPSPEVGEAPEQAVLPARERREGAPDSGNGPAEGNGAVVRAQADERGNGGGGESDLPFTGVDLTLVAVAGGLLLLLGLAIRRITRPADLA